MYNTLGPEENPPMATADFTMLSSEPCKWLGGAREGEEEQPLLRQL